MKLIVTRPPAPPETYDILDLTAMEMKTIRLALDEFTHHSTPISASSYIDPFRISRITAQYILNELNKES